jgi:hypothetical protein
MRNGFIINNYRNSSSLEGKMTSSSKEKLEKYCITNKEPIRTGRVRVVHLKEVSFAFIKNTFYWVKFHCE